LANYNYETQILSPEERNELDALDIIIGLSREERSYLLSVWRTSPNASAKFSPVRKKSVAKVSRSW
jgi:hypothetical protein